MSDRHDILCISSIDWDFVWQGHQEIMARYAAAGHRVLFIENTGVRTARFKDASRIWHRFQNWRRGVSGMREERPNLFVFSPLAIPIPHSRVISWINRWLMLGTIRRWMRTVGFARPIVWTFLPTRLTLDVLDRIDYDVLIYYCIDRFTASSSAARKIAKTESELLRRADLVFVTSRALETHCARHATAPIHRFPFAVDLQTFDAAPANGEPDDIRDLPRPRIGYVGGIHQWVDQELICATAQAHPTYSFVLVGPQQTDMSVLEQQPNVHLLGQRSHDQLPHYVRAFDVGLIPYRQTEYTRHVFPTKLPEYLAAGKPVVSTPLVEVDLFNEEFGAPVLVGKTPDDFARAVEIAATEADPLGREQRYHVAKANSWETRWHEMHAVIQNALSRRQAVRAADDWQQTLRETGRQARRSMAIAGVTIGALWVMMFYTPLLWWIGTPLQLEDVPQPADAIVVFAGGVGESGTAGQGYEERVQYAAQLYERGLAHTLIFSSGYIFALKEAQVMRGLAVELGVPPEAIYLEEDAHGTLDNVVLSTAIMRRLELQSALVVSSPYHMRRVQLVWHKQSPNIGLQLTPVPYSRFFGRQQHVLWRHWKAIAHEYVAILYYRLRGWL